MKKKEKTTQKALIKAFDSSETKTVTDICRRAGFSRVTFYSHFNTDTGFRRKFLEKQQKHLAQKIAAV